MEKVNRAKAKQNPSQPNSWVLVEQPPKPLSPEWTAQKFFADWTSEDLLLAVRKDVDIDLSPFIDYVAGQVGEALQKWFSEKLGRPDLGEVFKTEEAKKWLMKKMRQA